MLACVLCMHVCIHANTHTTCMRVYIYPRRIHTRIHTCIYTNACVLSVRVAAVSVLSFGMCISCLGPGASMAASQVQADRKLDKAKASLHILNASGESLQLASDLGALKHTQLSKVAPNYTPYTLQP